MKKLYMTDFSRIATTLFLTVALVLAGSAIMPTPTTAQFKNPPSQPNASYPSLVFTATSQTQAIILPGWSSCTISQTSVSNTTATWQAKLSNDGGTTYYAALVAPYAATVTPVTTAVTTTSTSGALFVVNVANFSNLEIVTSGTFTATSVSFKIVCSSNKGII